MQITSAELLSAVKNEVWMNKELRKEKSPHLSSFSASIPFNFRSVSTTSASAFSMSFCRSRRDWLSSRSRCRSCVDNTAFRRSEHDEGKATVKYTQNVSQGQSKWPTRNTTKKMENAGGRRHYENWSESRRLKTIWMEKRTEISWKVIRLLRPPPWRTIRDLKCGLLLPSFIKEREPSDVVKKCSHERLSQDAKNTWHMSPMICVAIKQRANIVNFVSQSYNF